MADRLVQGLDVPVRAERRVMYWFAPQGGTAPFAPDRHPVSIWEDHDGGDIYGFPALDGSDGGAKVAFHAKGSLADPDRLDREIHPEEVEAMRAYLRLRIPALADGRFLSGAACTYTLTPDEHFVLSPHPHHSQVTIACGFSGHGFKFVPVIGETIADLAIEGSTAHPIAPFDVRRFLTVPSWGKLWSAVRRFYDRDVGVSLIAALCVTVREPDPDPQQRRRGAPSERRPSMCWSPRSRLHRR
ncbi:FAD-dependent oxidoreductase [Streptomyces sp. NBC_00199]|uniref:FAD-dependent oxidoreductase n=1 Tax=Streptomyces sp. NBC_00199 TaxID=2975678 RepID=UPI0022572AED|nr:FAD-dependent oxidoreductase [Streptomyces sp. NBC_00199]MCX5262459.1 FAD-dependent oxidoreductase [Streptomyces sp. NBC_00199]